MKIENLEDLGGIASTEQHIITGAMVTFHMEKSALSTPSMISLIEGACHHVVLQFLDDRETTVGTHVNVSHLAPAFEGETLTVSCRLVEVDRRRLNFETMVQVGDRTLSVGTHQRAVISQ